VRSAGKTLWRPGFRFAVSATRPRRAWALRLASSPPSSVVASPGSVVHLVGLAQARARSLLRKLGDSTTTPLQMSLKFLDCEATRPSPSGWRLKRSVPPDFTVSATASSRLVCDPSRLAQCNRCWFQPFTPTGAGLLYDQHRSSQQVTGSTTNALGCSANSFSITMAARPSPFVLSLWARQWAHPDFSRAAQHLLHLSR